MSKLAGSVRYSLLSGFGDIRPVCARSRPHLISAMLFTITIFSLPHICAEFSPSFEQFLTVNYGKAFADRLARRDIGPQGSYGGGSHQGGSRTSRQAVILVHGITNTAGTFNGHRNHFLGVGWSGESVYGTTYGDGGKTPAPLVDMKCDYVKQIRWMIQSAASFTRRKVDIVGYSMGSPISRKAILGGLCVDTGENLGPPLTGLVDTFVSVAGANHGSYLCIVPLPGACNPINGLSCHSHFIQDINSRHRYEGKFIYSIYSMGDDKVGYRNGCGQVTSSIVAADKQFERPGNHDEVMVRTAQLQINLVDKHDPLGL